jgi:SAM-dependent methyltransferase
MKHRAGLQGQGGAEERVSDVATTLPPASIRSVIDAIRRGEPWRRALETAAVAAGTEEAIEVIASEACGNWVWLTSFDRREAALDIGGAVSSMAPALSRHFRTVHHVESSALLVEFAARRFAQDRLDNVSVTQSIAGALPFRHDVFDCVTLHGAIARIAAGRGAAAVRQLLRECRRVLHPGGRVYVAFDNPLWYGRLTDRAGRREHERAIVPSLRATGFSDLSRVFAFPSVDRPRALVTGTRRGFYARETADARGTVGRAVRRATAYVGLYSLLAPSVVIVARK